jgi:uroporphyrinogen decarboxylase
MLSSRDRVEAALERREPDRVPYCEVYLSRSFAHPLMGWAGEPDVHASFEANEFTVDEAKAVAQRLGMDNITYVLRAPIYADKVEGQGGTLFYGDGHIRTEADLPMVQLPDPFDDALYTEAESFAKNKGPYSAWFITRIGIAPTMLSMGIEAFSLALYDNRRLVERLLDLYVDWVEVVADRVCQLGFDVFVSTDDVAFGAATFFSPKVFRELVYPRFERVARKITLPWLFHSDGNVTALLDDFIGLGIAALHPIEPGAMDIRAVKRKYGDRLCLCGNVDMDLLSRGTVGEVDDTVRGLIRDIGPGGGYILTSGNSLAHYCRPENALAMSAAAQKYGSYPIKA